MDIIDIILKEEEESDSSRFSEWKKDFINKYPIRDVNLILEPVEEIISNINNKCKSFVVYGEPQSGKTEMMIALCCKLFDNGVNTIIVLMHDNKTLQIQNYQHRFTKNKNFRTTPILVEGFFNTLEKDRKNKNWLIFGRKNSQQLQKLILETRMLDNKIVLDDEADYATPDSNKGKKGKPESTKINQVMKELVGEGNYIGVTATPGRLDLNNTLYNDADKWVFCDPDKEYTGVKYFFPQKQEDIVKNYHLTLIPSDKDYSKYLEKAIYRFMARAAYINIRTNDITLNYSMVIHTSPKVKQHKQDENTVKMIIDSLQGNNKDKKKKLLNKILEETRKIFREDDCQNIMRFIYKNARSSTQLFTLNSQNDLNTNISALKPPSVFTFIFGGNTLSRGVTFENMLAFYFSRSVKNALQQNTYVQIARHFGYRKRYAEYFELTIPEDIWEKWYTCFLTHELSLEHAKNGDPLWIKHKFTNPVDSSSIDKKNVIVDSDGNISFPKFKFTKEIENLFCKPGDPLIKLKEFNKMTEDRYLPMFIINKIEDRLNGHLPKEKIDIIVSKNRHGELRDIINQKSLTDDEKREIKRYKSLAPGTHEKNIKDAFYYIVPYKNSETNEGRIHLTNSSPISYLKNIISKNNRELTKK